MKLTEALYKSYIFKNAFKDVAKFVKENLEDIEFDREYWLHKAGLSEYRPVRRTMGGFSLLLIGAAVGGIAALAFAPSRGTEFRDRVKDRAMNLFNQAQVAADSAVTDANARV